MSRADRAIRGVRIIRHRTVLLLLLGACWSACSAEEPGATDGESVTLEGELEVLVEDHDWGSVTRYFLASSEGERVELRLADAPALRTGDRVAVEGVRSGDEISVHTIAARGRSPVSSPGLGLSSARPSLTTVHPNTFGAQKTLMIIVTFSDNPQPGFTTVAAMKNLLFTTVDSYYRENSQNQTWLTGDVVGVYTIPVSSAGCLYTQIKTEAIKAAVAAGVDVTPYKRVIITFPKISCGWGGLGSVGGDPSYSWINGTLTAHLVGHELGHNFGLRHVRALTCGGKILSPSCTVVEYASPVDIMGANGVTGHINAYGKESLGWLDHGTSYPLTTVTRSGDYAIEPYAGTTSGSRALKIPLPVAADGCKIHYYVEYRRSVGWDSSLASSGNLTSGVVVHWTCADCGTTCLPGSYIQDMTPSTSTRTDAALTVGKSFVDSAAGVTLTTLGAGTTGATVRVTLGFAPACTVAADCSDGSACTTDTCNTTTGTCSHAKIAGCCTSSAECADTSACTVDTCVANRCQRKPISGCCTAAEDCDDGDACTLDRCDARTRTCSSTAFPCGPAGTIDPGGLSARPGPGAIPPTSGRPLEAESPTLEGGCAVGTGGGSSAAAGVFAWSLLLVGARLARRRRARPRR